ncbi:MAG: methyl-accepting chemotaxis protein [SAR324 cluster bacterium]|nr:methyl-accepting chemotaxis protein [SAR324 cluster bacterium]
MLLYWKNSRLVFKQTFAFSSIGLVIIIVLGSISYTICRNALETEAFNKLVAIREMKASHIEEYFQQIRNQVVTFSEDQMIIDAMKAFKPAFHGITQETGISSTQLDEMDQKLRDYYQNEYLKRLAPNLKQRVSVSDYWPEGKNTRILQHRYIAANSNPVGSKDTLDAAADSSTYSKVHQQFHPIIRNYLKKFGYYDIFLVDPETGHIVYTVFKEVDYGTSLLTGPYRDTNFAEVFRAARQASDKDFTKLIDFQPYHPSYNAPASFIASPIYDGSELIGVLIFQMPIDQINNIMTNFQKWADVGLGESGETYLVGGDYTLRNQSRFLIEDQENYFKMIKQIGLPQDKIDTIRSTQSAIGIQEINTQGVKAAIKGIRAKDIFPDYRGIPVLSAYKPLKIEDVQWVIMSEIDEAEAFESIYSLRNQIFLWAIGLILLTIVIGISFARLITNSIKPIIVRLNESTSQLASTSDQLSHNSEKLAEGAVEQAAGLEETSSSMEEISSQTKENAENAALVASSAEEMTHMVKESKANAENASKLSDDARQSAKNGADAMNKISLAMEEIGDASQQINKIIEVMNEISTQTNLLSLNAAIEAAKAGDHGKGFAVVADEVRKLAERSQQAAGNISTLIHESAQKAHAGMDLVKQGNEILQDILAKSENTADLVNSISVNTSEEVQKIESVENLIENIKIASEEQAYGIDEATRAIAEMTTVTETTAMIAEESASSSDELSSQSQLLQKLVTEMSMLV